jgi:hypothetical protein
VTRIGRDRDGRATRGTAVSRPPSSPVVYLPIYRYWYPYSGYGGYGGYYGYRWGLGWSPYGWNSFYWPYDPYWDPYYSGGGGGGEYEESERRTGNIRLRAKPAEAGVYINGAFVGKVDDFDGLTDHLELEGGVHQIEIRMDGYETYRGEITVEVGKTLTERLSLKKIK